MPANTHVDDASVAQAIALLTNAYLQLESPTNYQQGGATLQEFAKRPGALELSRIVLERTSDPRLQFHVANIIREVALNEFGLHTKEYMTKLRDFLVAYTLEQSKTGNANAVAVNKLLHTAAVLLKRGFLDLTQEERSAFFAKALQLRSASTSEESELKNILEIAVGWLEQYVFNSTLLHVDGELANAKQCTSIFLHVLSWEFTAFTTSFAGSFEKLDQGSADDMPTGSGKFPASWASMLVRPDVIDLAFRLHQLLAEDDESGIAMRCITQLASVRGPVFLDTESERAYSGHFIMRLMELVASFNATATFGSDSDFGEELTGIATTVKCFLSTYSLGTLGPLQATIPFLTEVCKLTMSCLKHMRDSDASFGSEASDEGAIVDNSWTADAADILMDGWSAVVLDAESKALQQQFGTAAGFDVGTFMQFLQSVGPAIFKTYLESKLASIEREAREQDQEEEDYGVDDRSVYEDQLLYLATMGRLNPGPALAVLLAETGERFQKLRLLIQVGGSAPQRGLLFEQLHWLTLISGFVIADSGVGETPEIHQSLAKLSQASADSSSDPVVLVPTLMLNILSYLTVADDSPMFEIISPLLLESLLCLSLRNAFTAEEGEKVLAFILDSCACNFKLWSGDSKVIGTLIELLGSLASVSAVRSRLLRSGVETELESEVYRSLVTSIQTRLHEVLGRGDFSQKYQASEIKLQIADTLEMFAGLSAAADFNNAASIFASVTPFFDTFAKLFGLYASQFDINWCILEVYLSIVKIVAFDAPDTAELGALSSSLISVLKLYADANQGIRGRTGEIEDELFKDLCIILEILNAALDFDKMVDVVFFGVNTILPLVTQDMLKLIEQHPAKLVALPRSLVEALMQSVRFGIEQPVADVQRLCLDGVTGLVSFCVRGHGAKDMDTPFLDPYLDGLLHMLLDTLLFRELDRGFVDAAGEALFSLIVYRHTTFTSLVQQLLSSQPDGDQRQLLHDGFTELGSAVQRAAGRVDAGGSGGGGGAPLLDNVTYQAFQESLVRFLMNARAFLRVK
ncbi:Exportin-4 [Cladochytrium tenue]|nr:Exportin-4 [Cladochytrium tenue]